MRVMEVKVKKNLIFVSPVDDRLRELLTFGKIRREPEYKYDPATGRQKRIMKVVTEPYRLYGIVNGGTTMVTFGGMYNRIRHWLETAGVSCKISGEHPKLPAPDYSDLPPLRHKQDHVLAAIASYPRGLIVASTAFGKTFMCGLVCKVWRDSRILLVAGSLSVCEGLSTQVLKHCDESEVRRHYDKYLRHKREQRKDPRVIVTSVASMGRITPNWPDLILFDEAHTAPSQTAMDGLMAHTEPKIFGLTASPEGRSDGADDMILALFGEVVLDVDYQEAVEHGSASQLTVYVVDNAMEEIEIFDDCERDAVGIWRNDARSGKMIAKAEEVTPDGESILYYVKTLEHALRIRKKFLPDVPIAHAGCSADEWKRFVRMGLVTEEDRADLGNPDVVQMEEDFRSGKLKRAICTTLWKQGTDFEDLRTLCRLDAEGSPISSTQIPGRAGRVRSDGTQRRGIIIDSNDDFGSGFHNRWLKRLRTYKKKGWDIVDA